MGERALGGAGDELRRQGLRLGAARRQVLAHLEEARGPVSAEEVVAALPDVHPSSVYRTLHVLEEVGLVTHVHLAHGPARYEPAAVASRVRHLVCEVCGADHLVPVEVFDGLRERLEAEYGFVLEAGHFALPGRCASCRSR